MSIQASMEYLYTEGDLIDLSSESNLIDFSSESPDLIDFSDGPDMIYFSDMLMQTTLPAHLVTEPQPSTCLLDLPISHSEDPSCSQGNFNRRG